MCVVYIQVLALKGELAEAIRTLKRALKLEPSNKVKCPEASCYTRNEWISLTPWLHFQ